MGTTIVTMAAEYSITNGLYQVNGKMNSDCLLNFSECATVPFLHAMIDAWFGWERKKGSSAYDATTFQLGTRNQIVARLPNLVCLFQSFDSRDGKYYLDTCSDHGINEGLTHSSTTSYSYVIRLLRLTKSADSIQILIATNATLRRVHRGLTLRGDLQTVNHALQDVTYVTHPHWNTRMYGHDQIHLEVADVTTTGTAGGTGTAGSAVKHSTTRGSMMVNVIAVNDPPTI